MVDRAYIQQLFLQLVQTDSESLHELRVAELCMTELRGLGFAVETDSAGEVLGGEVGNVIATLPGDDSLEPVLLAAHMDTVRPGAGVRAHIDGAGVVWSDGTTVLGADDKAGITAILAGLRELVRSATRRPPIQVVFTIAEELGLQGAKHLDRSRLFARVGLSLDSGGQLGTFVVAAPSQVKWNARFVGRSAHAGVAPERGISAIRVAAQAVSRMPHGRLDGETTVNVGSFVGDGPSNVVRDVCTLQGEARSLSPTRLQEVLAEIESVFGQTARQHGAEVDFEAVKMYDGFRFEADAPVRRRVEAALAAVGFRPAPKASGGGSDANIYTALGIPTVNIGIGYEDIHSTQEHIALADIEAAARVVAAFCSVVE